jgi:hypothetical protein
MRSRSRSYLQRIAGAVGPGTAVAVPARRPLPEDQAASPMETVVAPASRPRPGPPVVPPRIAPVAQPARRAGQSPYSAGALAAGPTPSGSPDGSDATPLDDPGPSPLVSPSSDAPHRDAIERATPASERQDAPAHAQSARTAASNPMHATRVVRSAAAAFDTPSNAPPASETAASERSSHQRVSAAPPVETPPGFARGSQVNAAGPPPRADGVPRAPNVSPESERTPALEPPRGTEASRPRVPGEKASAEGPRVHIGTVEIRTSPPAPPAPRRFAPLASSQALAPAATERLGRGVAWRWGLIQS